MSGFLGDTMASILGGGRPGGQPKGGLIGGSEGLSMIGGSTRGRDRAVLRRAFGNSVMDGNIKTLKTLQAYLALSSINLSLEEIRNIFFPSPSIIAGQGTCSPSEINYIKSLVQHAHGCEVDGSTCGQFRANMAAGDTINGKPNLEVNRNWGPVANQVGGVGRNQGYNKRGGVHSFYLNVWTTENRPLPNQIGATYSGNPKYVYDSSDYIRYKKLAAKNKNYNDSKFGGASKQYPYSALAKVRH